MEKNILLVLNPNAGSTDKKELVETVHKIVVENGFLLQKYETTGKDDVEKLKEKVAKWRPERILIAGGDGTVNLVGKTVAGENIILGILPCGSANGLATNLNIPKNLQEQVEVALGDKTKSVDHLNINGESCFHISDLGLNAELINHFQTSMIRGKLGYLLQAVPTLIESDFPFTFHINIDGNTITRTGIILAFANAKKYGTGVKINPYGKLDDGKFEVLVFKSFDIPEILHTIYEGTDLNSDFAECFTTDHVVVTSDTPIPFQIDGEPQGDVTRVEASIFPEQLEFCIP